MPAATPIKKREEIVRRQQAGESFAQIAREMSMSYHTVRNVWRYCKRTGQLEPAYDRCVHEGVRKDKAIYEKAIEFKREHPTWGAGLIWVELADLFAEESLPSVRTLRRWFHRAGLVVQEGKDKRPKVSIVRGQDAHEVWTMDAKEQMTLGDGSKASWLIISDEGSGAMLHGTLFPYQSLETD